MKRVLYLFLRLLPLLVIGLGAYYFATRTWDSSRRESPEEARRSLSKIGEQAVNFELNRFGNPPQAFQLNSLKGQGILLNFWATWCGPCVKELPSLLAVAREYKKKGLQIVAVSADRDWATIDRFLDRYPALAKIREDFVLVLDPELKATGLYGVDRFPESFLINRKFVVDLRLSGEQAWEDPQYRAYYDRILHQGE